MALITCPECKQSISAQAVTCPHCGFPLQAYLVTIKSDNPTRRNDVAQEDADSKGSGQRSNRVKIVTAIIIAIVVCAIVCVTIFCLSDKQREIEQDETRKSTNQQDVNQESTAARAKYIETLDKFSLHTAWGCAKAGEASYRIMSVWYDTEFKVSNKDTIEFTQTNGQFHDDYHTSIQKLLASEEVGALLDEIIENKQVVDSYYKAMLHPDAEFKECFDIVEEVYQKYYDLTMLALLPSGDFIDYGETRAALIEETAKLINSLKLLIPEK